MSREAIFLGVDGGGSSTVAWICDINGHILAKAEAGPSNVKAIGEAAALEALDAAIAAAVEVSGRPSTGFDVACLGLAGLDRPEDRGFLERWNAERGWARRLLLVNDGELVLAAGTPEGWGVAVIAGTGSIAVARSRTGDASRAGGWGHVFGDEGSGYGTAVAALRRVARLHDGRSPGDWKADPLAKAVCEVVGVADPTGLVSEIYAPSWDRARIATIAAAVVTVGRSDPEIVLDLLEPAGLALADTARAAAERLGLPRKGLPLAMAGGFLLSADAVSDALLEGLRVAGFDVVPGRVDDPVSGALALARRAWKSSLTVDGAVECPGRWSFEELASFAEADQVRDVSRFPSKKAGDGVTLKSVLARVRPTAEASYLTLHSSKDDFHVSVPLGPIRDQAVIVYALGGAPLDESKGGPFRFLIRDPSACHTSELDDCANVKFLDRIELTAGKGLDTRPADDAAHEALHASQG